jgi:hypothetical protein
VREEASGKFEKETVPLVSIRGYAKHRGVSHTAVEKAVKQGRIRTVDGKIDVEQADRDWNRNSSPVNKPKAAPRAAAAPEPLVAGPSFAQSRAVREAYEARLAKLTWEERIKKLINADEVRVSAYNFSRMIRDRLFNVPDRVVGAVLAEIRAALTTAGVDLALIEGLNMAKVHGIMLAEMRNILEEFADELGQR